MDVRLLTARSSVLVIGYGNTLRSDDGVGQRVALRVAAWERPGVTALAVHQLTPELAEPLAAASLAIFVDARSAEWGEGVEVSALAPAEERTTTAHASNVRELLALVRDVYGRAPRSWLVTVPATAFSVGDGLSAIAERGASDALERIAALAAQLPGDLE
jgi:hydrogenase maturation protease